MIDVMLIAPVRAYRDALTAAINADLGLAIVSHAASGAEALARVNPPTPAVALLDFCMDDVLPALAALRRTLPAILVVAIAVPPEHARSEAVIGAAEAGVSGFVDADQPLSDIIEAVRITVTGQSSCSPRIAAILLRALQRRPVPSAPAPWAPTAQSAARAALTPRELVVAQLVVRGMTNRQIAGVLVLGEATVKSHVHAVLRKLGVERREQIGLSDVLDLHAHLRPPLPRRAPASPPD